MTRYAHLWDESRRPQALPLSVLAEAATATPVKAFDAICGKRARPILSVFPKRDGFCRPKRALLDSLWGFRVAADHPRF